MNMNGIYASGTSSFEKQGAISRESKNQVAFEKGQVIEGIVSNVSEQVSINFSGRECKFSKETVPDAREGEVRKFEITDVSKNGIVLKEVGSTSKQGERRETTLLFTQIGNVNGGIKQPGTTPTSVKEEEQTLNQNLSSMTEEDYEELSEEGIGIEEYEQERLARALERIKTQRELKQNAVNAQTESLEKSREMAENAARAWIPESGLVKSIVEHLQNADMPVTKENVERIAGTMSLASTTQGLSDNAMAYLIKNELEASISNVYKAQHSGTVTRYQEKEEAWNELKEASKQIIKESNLTVSEDTLSQSRWLLERDLPMTEDNLRYKLGLDKLTKENWEEKALSAAVKALKAGQNPEEGVILSIEEERQQSNIEAFHSITEDTIAKGVYLQKESKAKGQSIPELNLRFLQQIQSEDRIDNKALQSIQEDLGVITAKRQLEEIRLKMTLEASMKLSEKGLSIETESLQKVVEGLRELEDEYYQKLSKEAGLETQGQTALLKESLTSLEVLRGAPATVLSETFTGRNQVTLKSLQEFSVGETAQQKRTSESYEKLMTSPRTDLGDSIKKAFASVDSLLKDIGFEATETNQRAVRILGYNQIEITPDNVIGMKAYDAKVNEVVEGLKPSVTAVLIKDGVNPLSMNLNELADTLQEYRKASDTNSEDGFAKYLVELETKDGITPKERDSYIGIYRLLHQIQQSDGAAVGAVVKAGKELTLKNLLTEVRTGKSGKIDEKVEDELGNKEISTGYLNSITAQIDAGFYGESLIRKLEKELSPDSLGRVMSEENYSVYDSTLETLSEKLAQSLENNRMNEIKSSKDENGQQAPSYEENQLEYLRENARNSTEELRFLKEYELPNSLHNIIATKELLGENEGIYRTVQKLREKNESKVFGQENVATEVTSDLSFDFNELGSKERLNEALEEFYESVTTLAEQSLKEGDVTSGDVLEVRRLKSMLQLNQSLNQKEHYNIPLITNDSVTNINLTVIHNAGEGKVSITYPSNRFGLIQAEFTVKEENKCFLTVEEQDALEDLKENKEFMIDEFDRQGIIVSQLNFGLRSKSVESYLYKSGKFYKESQISLEKRETGEKIKDINTTDVSSQEEPRLYKTEELYQIAKTILQSLQQIDT